MEKIPKIDLHQDISLHIHKRDILLDTNHWQTDFEKITSSNTKIVIASGFPLPQEYDIEKNFYGTEMNTYIEDDFDFYQDYCNKNSNWRIIKDSKDIKDCISKDDEFGLLLHIEGLNAFSGSSKEWIRLEKWNEQGWRSLGLVWNLQNSLGGGNKSDDQDLTVLGAEMINWLQGNKMIVDFAHMNYKTFMSASKIMRQPIIISHGGASSVRKHPRNYTDEQLKAVADTDGVIGMYLVRYFLTEKIKATLDDIFLHIDYIVKSIGIDHVTIGSDFGGLRSLPFVEDLESVDKIDNLFEKLSQEGYTESMIEKIAYKNSKRVLVSILD